ncbi:hypothetical protein GPECTOR_1g884 [Gonium pectorale]|uniref:Uncharacterized protein n=1 Tax=Gonium pectorale TaxID=33097 RepID=A0A150H4C2_GONPE|nr:hypothetical protein GPECTOR_1g884 [Gonium pectorale]|eukprot:KXZ56979.1 hypothetical protein GPECTOR_1g884 [Gonium pectorale]
MGQEGSKLDGEQEQEERIVLQGSGQSRPSGSGAAKSATPGTTPPKTTWMRPAQSRAPATVEIRHAVPKPAPAARPKRATGGGDGGAPQEVLSSTGQLGPEQEFGAKFESTKKELVKKLAVQIKSTQQLKDPAGQSRSSVSKQSSLQSRDGKEGSAKRSSWLSKLTRSKSMALEALGRERLERGGYCAPMDQAAVGGRVASSLGNQLDQFGSMQGALHHIMQQGVTDDMLDQFFFDEEEERVLPTYQKWQIIRAAAEQVLAVYANRSNSQWIEDESWGPPNVVNTTAASASMYSNAVDAALTAGSIALMLVDDGRLAEMGGDEVSPLVASDLWQAIKELAPNKVPSGQRLERLSVAGRYLLHAAVSVEMWYGHAALKNIKVVLAIDCDVEYFIVQELQQWSFFGLQPGNVVLLPLPRFHGFAQDLRSGHLAHVKGSPRLMLGTGYAMFLLNSPAEAYTLGGADGTEPQCLQGSVLEWLLANQASWLYTGLFSDLERLRPEALFDMDFLAAGLAAVDRTGANMAVEVMHGEREREARLHDSVILARTARSASAAGGSASAASSSSSPTGSRPGSGHPGHAGSSSGIAATAGSVTAAGGGSGGGAASGGSSGAVSPGRGGPPSNCNLRPSSMRTAKSYQLLSSTATSPHGFYIASHRYVFSVKALQKLLVDPRAFHADVYLQDFYAYATFDISDLTTFQAASCACILGSSGLRAPVMSEVIYGREWLAEAANVLALQDNVKEFRRKAVQLYDQAKAAAASGSSVRASTYKEKGGFGVLLVITPEHSRLVKPAIRMCRLFVHNVVDKLHVALVVQEGESKTRIKELLDLVTDRELEFSGRLSKEVVLRQGGASVTEAVVAMLPRLQTQLLVVPSERLCPSGAADLGQVSGSAALGLARAVSSLPLLIVKANTVGRFLNIPSQAGAGVAGGPALPASAAAASSGTGAAGASKDVVTAMVHLDTTSVGPLVEFVSSCLAAGSDALFLARTHATERDGSLSMRSRRVFVQARMAVAQAIKVEERAYAGAPAAELPKAVEAEGVDLLALSCPPDLAISKDTESLLQLCRTSILIHRAMTATPSSAGAAWT